jgi:hypothetical protein
LDLGSTRSLDRKALARLLLTSGLDEVDLELRPPPPPAGAGLAANLVTPFPAGLAPLPRPPAHGADPSAPLPRADVVVVTWTTDEQDGLADVLTPGFGRKTWTRYNRHFADRYADQTRPGAPARLARRLGSWLMTRIGQRDVLCFKSELHLNQDGMPSPTAPGQTTLPVKDLFAQLIEEARPSVVLTVGTGGGVFRDHDLGDVTLTRAAKFRCRSEFGNAPFNGKTFKSEWNIPTTHFGTAVQLMGRFASRLAEPPLLGPTVRHAGQPFQAPTYSPDIKQDGTGGIPAFHPILTTDFFEFGTSTNGLEHEGIAVEMGDAALGLAASEMANPPRWAVVRNLSDPQINGELEADLQALYAVWYYKQYGYWTSVMSALVTWAIVAGL